MNGCFVQSLAIYGESLVMQTFYSFFSAAEQVWKGWGISCSV